MCKQKEEQERETNESCEYLESWLGKKLPKTLSLQATLSMGQLNDFK